MFVLRSVSISDCRMGPLVNVGGQRSRWLVRRVPQKFAVRASGSFDSRVAISP